MSNWPKNVDACLSCTGSADRYPHGARGHCVRCNDLLLYIRHVRAWNQNQPETLKRIADASRYTDDQLEIIRAEHLRQLEARLALFRLREQIRGLEFPVSGLDIEEKFQKVLGLMSGIRRRDRVRYPQNASYISQHFDADQRRVLYALLEEVIEMVPWRGINWMLVFSLVYPQ